MCHTTFETVLWNPAWVAHTGQAMQYAVCLVGHTTDANVSLVWTCLYETLDYNRVWLKSQERRDDILHKLEYFKNNPRKRMIKT